MFSLSSLPRIPLFMQVLLLPRLALLLLFNCGRQDRRRQRFYGLLCGSQWEQPEEVEEEDPGARSPTRSSGYKTDKTAQAQ